MLIKTMPEAHDALRAFVPKDGLGAHYTLDTMRTLLSLLGNPQEKLRVIHVAGTSGKTSTAYFIRDLLQAAGKRTGLTVSPHIVSVAERVQVGGHLLNDASFIAYLNQFLPLIKKSGLAPSYFETILGFAYWVFVQEHVEYAVVETGLGGLLDATNTVRRADKLCVITDIGLDHTELLGDTLTKIAAHKAGIIQPGNLAVTLPQASTIIDVITARVTTQHATLHVAELASTPDLPPYQQRNWSLALAAYHALGLPPIAPIAFAPPPGRMEIFRRGGKTIILDGAHNAQKLQALHAALAVRGVQKTAVMANLVAAPPLKITQALDVLAGFASWLIVPEFAVGQDFYNRASLSADDFAAQAKSAGIAHVVSQKNIAVALEDLLACPEETLVITGSLYLIAVVRPLLTNGR